MSSPDPAPPTGEPSTMPAWVQRSLDTTYGGLSQDAYRRLCLKAFENLPSGTAVTMADVDAILTWCLPAFDEARGDTYCATMIDDLGSLLRALGMGDHARPESPHDTMRRAITEARRIVTSNVRQASTIRGFTQRGETPPREISFNDWNAMDTAQRAEWLRDAEARVERAQ